MFGFAETQFGICTNYMYALDIKYRDIWWPPLSAAAVMAQSSPISFDDEEISALVAVTDTSALDLELEDDDVWLKDLENMDDSGSPDMPDNAEAAKREGDGLLASMPPKQRCMSNTHAITAMAFLANAITYCDRTNISLAILPIAEAHGWNTYQVGIVLSGINKYTHCNHGLASA